jgi:lipoprotein signal peptidase
MSAVLLALWIVACDLWIKALTRAATCVDFANLLAAVRQPWTPPGSCHPLPLTHGLQLHPSLREGLAFGFELPPGAGPLCGLAWIALATVISILVTRWRWRIGSDALALGTLWAGAGIHAFFRLTGPGAAFTDFEVATFGTFALADVAIGWALLWLAWRWLGELRG